MLRCAIVLALAALPPLSGCIELPLYQDSGPDLAEHYAMCLAPDRPAHSPQLTDCVLARYGASLREDRRLRIATGRYMPPVDPATERPGDR